MLMTPPPGNKLTQAEAIAQSLRLHVSCLDIVFYTTVNITGIILLLRSKKQIPVLLFRKIKSLRLSLWLE